MKLLKYNDYLSESILFELIIESKVVYSTKFMNILKKMKTNNVAQTLLSLYSKDLNIQHNYIDLTDEKDTVSFTPDRKVKEVLDKQENIWRVINSERYLTHSDSNRHIFNALNYDIPDEDPWSAPEGAVGSILGETVSQSSGRTYVIFKTEDGQMTVLNKEALVDANGTNDRKVWSTSRNNIKVGRLARAILSTSSLTFTDKDIEDFTNQFKATFDSIGDAFSLFEVVKGKDIAFWYKKENYKRGDGSLNNSCMGGSDSEFFDIYTKNPQVSLVILHDKDDETKISGRAILWDAKKTGDGEIKFMDRIYTTFESDTELFKQYAQKNNWWWKKRQTYDLSYSGDITNGTENLNGEEIFCELDVVDFEYYPYVDTLCFIDLGSKIASNYNNDSDRALRDTDGEWSDPDDY